MAKRIIPLFLVALTTAGCFPRLAHYDGEPEPRQPYSQSAQGPAIPLDPNGSMLPSARILNFIQLSNPALAPSVARLEADLIAELCPVAGVPTNLVVSLIATESSFNPRATSPMGARGLGQLMPATARDLGVNDAYDIEQNLRGTIRYVAQLGRIWARHPRRWEMALASYLAGVGTVGQQVKAGRDLTNEQSSYVRKILQLSGRV